MKKLLSIFILVLSFASCIEAQTNGITKIIPAELKEINTSAKINLVDVRTPEEFSEGHIQGAENVNVKVANFQKNISKFDTTEPIYVYCRSGNRSGQAAAILKEMGFQEIYDLEGGILQWEAENLPTEK